MGQRQIAHVNINGVPEGIFEFLFCTRDFGPPRGGGQPPPSSKKSEKFFFRFSIFFLMDVLEGCLVCYEITFFTKISRFFCHFTAIQDKYSFSHFFQVQIVKNARSSVYEQLFLLFTSPRTSFSVFLDASSHLYKRVCPSVRRSVRPSVRRSVRPSVRSSVGPWVTHS